MRSYRYWNGLFCLYKIKMHKEIPNRKRGLENPYFIDRTGERHQNNQGCWFTIIEYRRNDNVTVQFDDGHIKTGVWYKHIISGSVKNPCYPSVAGIGYEGIGKYSKKTHPKIYERWHNIFTRCYDEKALQKRPSYRDCSIYERWHNFQNFAEWFEEKWKPWMDKTWQVDKDILKKGNKIYSPETCCIVPQEINTQFVKRQNNKDKCPIGVSKRGKRFMARLNKYKDPICLGTFDTIEEAFQAYKIAKEVYIKELADKWKPFIDPRAYESMYNYQVEITD